MRGDQHASHSMNEKFFTDHVLPKLGALRVCSVASNHSAAALVRMHSSAGTSWFRFSAAGFAEVSLEKKRNLFNILDADHDGVLSAAEQRGARTYQRED